MNRKQDAATKKNTFVHKLYTMLQDEEISHLIWWSEGEDSNTFALCPGKEFSNVLTKYFKHGNVASFVRQLHMYGFHKVSDLTPSGLDALEREQTIWEFKHSSGKFRKNDEASLVYIKRRTSNNNTKNFVNENEGNVVMQRISREGTHLGPMAHESELKSGQGFKNEMMPPLCQQHPQPPLRLPVARQSPYYLVRFVSAGNSGLMYPYLRDLMTPILTPPYSKDVTHKSLPLENPMDLSYPRPHSVGLRGSNSVDATKEEVSNDQENNRDLYGQLKGEVENEEKELARFRESNAEKDTRKKQRESSFVSGETKKEEAQNPSLQFRQIWQTSSENARPRNPSLLYDPLAPSPVYSRPPPFSETHSPTVGLQGYSLTGMQESETRRPNSSSPRSWGRNGSVEGDHFSLSRRWLSRLDPMTHRVSSASPRLHLPNESDTGNPVVPSDPTKKDTIPHMDSLISAGTSKSACTPSRRLSNIISASNVREKIRHSLIDMHYDTAKRNSYFNSQHDSIGSCSTVNSEFSNVPSLVSESSINRSSLSSGSITSQFGAKNTSFASNGKNGLLRLPSISRATIINEDELEDESMSSPLPDRSNRLPFPGESRIMSLKEEAVAPESTKSYSMPVHELNNDSLLSKISEQGNLTGEVSRSSLVSSRVSVHSLLGEDSEMEGVESSENR